MPTTLDLPDVRRFTGELQDRLRQCDNGEGRICSNLDESISHYVQLCHDLRGYIHEWARAIFSGRIAFEPETENLLQKEARLFLRRAKDLAALGRAMDEKCFKLHGLDLLHRYIADLDYLLENWVSPRRAVSPAPRVKVPDAAGQQVIERLEKVSALPSDWQSSDPEQLAFFKKQRAE